MKQDSTGKGQSPFLTDVETLRQRARKQIEEGALTEGYRGDPKVVVGLLNEALATEIVCVLRYRRHYFMAQGLNSESVKKELHEDIKEAKKLKEKN